MTPKRLSDRAFGLAFAVILTALAAARRIFFDAEGYWPMGLAAFFLATALAAPGLLLPLNRLWTRLAHLLGWLSNHLLLGLFFFLLIWPLGLIIRLAGHDPMSRKLEPGSGSYWRPVGRQANAETFEDMF